MAQSATQGTTGKTRIKGPAVVSLRGASSTGHEFTFGSAGPVGTGLDVGLTLNAPAAQVANILQWDLAGTALGGIDAAGGLVTLMSAGANLVSRRTARITLSAAQIITLNSAPVVLVAAPGAGKLLIPQELLFEFTFNSVQFTGGGAVSVVNTGQTTSLLAGSLPAATLTAAATSYTVLGGNAGANGQALLANTGLSLKAATADFAAGNSTAVLKLRYDVITLG